MSDSVPSHLRLVVSRSPSWGRNAETESIGCPPHMCRKGSNSQGHCGREGRVHNRSGPQTLGGRRRCHAHLRRLSPGPRGDGRGRRRCIEPLLSIPLEGSLESLRCIGACSTTFWISLRPTPCCRPASRDPARREGEARSVPNLSSRNPQAVSG